MYTSIHSRRQLRKVSGYLFFARELSAFDFVCFELQVGQLPQAPEKPCTPDTRKLPRYYLNTDGASGFNFSWLLLCLLFIVPLAWKLRLLRAWRGF